MTWTPKSGAQEEATPAAINGHQEDFVMASLYPTLSIIIKKVIKSVAFNTRLHRLLFNVYQFGYGPTELIFLTDCVSSVSAIPGTFVEAGCAYGATTVFLNKFMEERNINRDYYAIDTFSGFNKTHLAYEARQGRRLVGQWSNSRGVHHRYNLRSLFSDNRQSWFDKTMQFHGIAQVRSVKEDVSHFDFSTIAPIAFCLLDVDFYLPIKESLPKIYNAMAPGGVLIVDDCRPNDQWDGALRAYEEFVEEKGMRREIVCEKLGLVRVHYQ